MISVSPGTWEAGESQVQVWAMQWGLISKARKIIRKEEASEEEGEDGEGTYTAEIRLKTDKDKSQGRMRDRCSLFIYIFGLKLLNN